MDILVSVFLSAFAVALCCYCADSFVDPLRLLWVYRDSVKNVIKKDFKSGCFCLVTQSRDLTSGQDAK